VASSISGISELLVCSRGGIAVTPENPHDLAEAILHLLQDDDLREEMGSSGCAYVTENHTWAKVAANVAGILAAGAGEVPSPPGVGDVLEGRHGNE
jgi:glycosyltransferase involved in cell wall biosynthesis